MIRLILALLFAILFLILGLPVLGAEWLLRKTNRQAADLSSLRIVQWAFKVIIFICGIKLIVRGEENVPRDKAVLYIANHRSYFDTIIGYSRCPNLTGFISKDSMAKVPILKTWMERLYCLFLNRDNTKEGMKTILSAISYVREGISIWIYPEGTRSHEKDMLPFKDGSFKISTKTGCPIIPVALSHTADIFENHMPFIRKTTVVMTFGTPIDPGALADEQRKHIGSYVQGIISDMLAENEKIPTDW